ncbi:unnamed protein product [Camellia sinensis]
MKFDSSAWSRLHSTIANPLDFRPLASVEIIQEQITRVLLERLIVNRPHPWGLLITFTELIKLKIYRSISYAAVAAHADKSGRCKLAAMLVEHEPRSSNIGEEDTALTKATESCDTDLFYLVLFNI